jgi:hypothetical protein
MSQVNLPGEFLGKLKKAGVSQGVIATLTSPVKLDISPETADELRKVCVEYRDELNYLNVLRIRYKL